MDVPNWKRTLGRLESSAGQYLVRLSVMPFDRNLLRSDSAFDRLPHGLDQLPVGRPQRLVEVASEVAPKIMVEDQLDHIAHVLGAKDILAATFEFHLDQISQTHRDDPVDFDRPPRRPGKEIPRHKLHGNPMADEFPPLFIELETFRDQQILEGRQRWVNEDVDIGRRPLVTMQKDGNPADDDPLDAFAAHELR